MSKYPTVPTTAELLHHVAEAADYKELRAIRQDALHTVLGFVNAGFRLVKNDQQLGEEEVIDLADKLASYVLNGKLAKDPPKEAP